jgi:RNA polymerase sigma factor (sigma-70 family)
MSPSVKQVTKLVKGCVANDRSSQEQLYKLFYADLLPLCCRYLKTNSLAQEALNMGFLKVFQHIATYNADKGEFGAWLRAIIIRTCIDLGRKEQRFALVANDAQIGEDIFIPPTILNKLYAEDLLKLIRLLPDATQLVFNLSVIDGYSHKEIAEQLNINEGTSRWHLSEGKKQLRALLEIEQINNNPTVTPKN